MLKLNDLQKKFVIILGFATLACILVTISGYEIMSFLSSPQTTAPPTGNQTATVPVTVHITPTPTPQVAALPVVDYSTIMGIDSGPPSLYPGIGWTRLSYVTCGVKHMHGNKLRNSIQLDHTQGVRVLLLLCQEPSHLMDMQAINDVATAGADAVDCGNEEMKHNAYATYVAPDQFARFFDACEKAVHAVNAKIPVLLGSLDPHVGYIDHAALLDQVSYLNAMQQAMNSSVHPGGNWSWKAQTMGLIDSWHNGFPDQSINSLLALFTFWAQQFGVSLDSGALGQHIWVVEGTGCVLNCGLNSNYQIAVAHILTLIIDVETAKRYKVPFFYFSGKDFVQQGQFWPMGVLSLHGNAKPLRQDLKLGARSLNLSCSGSSVNVIEQELLLAKLYSGCSLPGNYITVLST